MIERYQLAEMGRVWSVLNRFQRLLDVEKSVALAQAKLKIIPQNAAVAIQDKAKFDLKRIQEIEKTTKHDVIAFVSSVAESVGPEGKFVHFGLTSSDVLDTALSLQIREALEILRKKNAALEKVLISLAREHRDTVCAGRTHGMHAEPTTFGLKIAGFLAELKRNWERLERSCLGAAVVKLSGAVGTYSSFGPLGIELEDLVAIDLKLRVETVATQVVPRDRHAEIFCNLALLGAGFERMAVEIRHLQRTEVAEVEESFESGQKGSSAMPHKKNPIASENVTGLARLLRSYALASLEDIALWHERDISHSSVERVIFPDAFALADYSYHRITQIYENLKVNKERMAENMAITYGQVFSSHVLLELIRRGMSREDAYKIIQRVSHNELGPKKDLQKALLEDKEASKSLTPEALNKIFSGEAFRGNVHQIIERALI